MLLNFRTKEPLMSKDRTVKSTFLNMCMIYDEKRNMVLVQDKLKKAENEWCGLIFPGGHIEDGESFITSVIREVKEETGLDISEVKPCGLVNWFNADEPERWIVFLYKTSTYRGELITETSEGKVYWMDLDEFLSSVKAPSMDTYMKIFLEDNINEAFATWGNNGTNELEIQG